MNGEKVSKYRQPDALTHVVWGAVAAFSSNNLSTSASSIYDSTLCLLVSFYLLFGSGMPSSAVASSATDFGSLLREPAN